MEWKRPFTLQHISLTRAPEGRRPWALLHTCGGCGGGGCWRRGGCGGARSGTGPAAEEGTQGGWAGILLLYFCYTTTTMVRLVLALVPLLVLVH